MLRLVSAVALSCLTALPAFGQDAPWDAGRHGYGCSPSLGYCAAGDGRFELRREFGEDALWSVAVVSSLAPDETLTIIGPTDAPALIFAPDQWSIEGRPDRAVLLPSPQTQILIGWLTDWSINSLMLEIGGGAVDHRLWVQPAFLHEGYDWIMLHQPALAALADVPSEPEETQFSEIEIELAHWNDLASAGGHLPETILAAHARLSPECRAQFPDIGAEVLWLGQGEALFKLLCTDDYATPGARLYRSSAEDFADVALVSSIPLWQPEADDFVATSALPGQTRFFPGLRGIWTEYQIGDCSARQSLRAIKGQIVPIEVSGWRCRRDADGTYPDWDLQLYLAPEVEW